MTQPCIVCGAFTRRRTRSGQGWHIDQCQDCGLGYTDPPPGPGSGDMLYNGAYYAEHYGATCQSEEHTVPGPVARDRFLPILDGLRMLGAKGRLLDVGCATGDFLSLARQSGWDIAGTECSPYAVAAAEERLQCPVYQDDLAVVAQKVSPFDAVTLHHVIEHVDNPREFVGHVFQLLKPGGYLYIECPNFDSLEAAVFREHWEDIRPEQHVHHFTPMSLTRLIKETGLQPVCLRTLITASWHLRDAMEYMMLPVTYFKERRHAISSENTSQRVGGAPPPAVARLGTVKKLLRYPSWLLFRPLTWCEERLLRGKRLAAYARKPFSN